MISASEVLARDYKLVYIVTLADAILLYHVQPAYPPLELSDFELPQGPIGAPVDILVFLTTADDEYILSSRHSVSARPKMVKGAVNVIGRRMIRQNLTTLLPGFKVQEVNDTSSTG